MTVDANRVSDAQLRVLIEDLEGDTGSIPTSVVLLRNLVTELLSRRSPSLSGGEVVAWRVRERPGFDWRFVDGDPGRDPRLNGYEKQPLYASPAPDILAAKDAEIERLRAAFGQAGDQSIGQQLRIKVLEGERDELTYLHSERDQGEKIINERLEAAEARANAAEAAIHLIQEEAEKDNSPLGRSDSLALERIRAFLSTLNGAKP